LECELEEVERDYIEFRKEMGEYNTETVKNSIFLAMTDTVKSLS
jgi:hypothetical protein